MLTAVAPFLLLLAEDAFDALFEKAAASVDVAFATEDSFAFAIAAAVAMRRISVHFSMLAGLNGSSDKENSMSEDSSAAVD